MEINLHSLTMQQLKASHSCIVALIRLQQWQNHCTSTATMVYLYNSYGIPVQQLLCQNSIHCTIKTIVVPVKQLFYTSSTIIVPVQQLLYYNNILRI